MDSFAGKTAVITGGASGIGRAMAERFAEARMQVVLADVEKDALERTVAEMQERQYRVLGVVTDTMRRDSMTAMAEAAIAEFGKIHILCNNAGVFSRRTAPVWELPHADWDWLMGVNFYGVLYGLQDFIPHMLAHGEASHIVNTASVAGLITGGGPYGVSKHGVLTLTEGLKQDLTAHGANISASVLCPGFVDTKIFKAERNRPNELAAGIKLPTQEDELDAVLKQGKQPSFVAEAVFNAITQDDFYILPHPAWDDIIRARVDHVLQRQQPYSADIFQSPARPDGERL